METITISGITHPGRRRKENQDTCITRYLRAEDKLLAAVIDGVGGYAGGERAAAVAKECIEQYMQTPSGDTMTMLREAVVYANNQVTEERKSSRRLSAMCCVLTALVADTLAQRIYFVHVGDTRLYRYRDGRLQKLTRDHSVVGVREDAGEISEEEAMVHPNRNQILRAVGSALHRLDDGDFIDYGCDALVPGDVLLLCSDGLTDMISSKQVTEVLAGNQPVPEKTNRLVALANESGGYDNITVVLLHYPLPVNVAENTVLPGNDVANSGCFTVPPAINVKRSRGEVVFISACMLLLLIAGTSWFMNTRKKATMPLHVNVVPGPGITPGNDSAVAYATPQLTIAPVSWENADTLRISVTQDYARLKRYADSTGKPLVLLPGKSNRNQFAAVDINVKSAKPGDTLLLRNLRVIGFENGIDIHLPVLLKAENLVFENTTHPFRYLFTPGEKQASLLFMNTMKQ